jgi:hypothetical protein
VVQVHVPRPARPQINPHMPFRGDVPPPGISVPFWIKPTGWEAPFSRYIKAWLGYSAVILRFLCCFAARSVLTSGHPGRPPARDQR